jgi:hypothetical protein
VLDEKARLRGKLEEAFEVIKETKKKLDEYTDVTERLKKIQIRPKSTYFTT